ncbi:MAG TPA: DUF2914 domain-containing protein [Candidatus Paceibacterota bacterium]
MIEKGRQFFRKYERYVSPVTLVTGFIFDSIMLRRIDVLFSNALLIGYLSVSALSILLLNVHQTREEARRSETFHITLIFLMQFCLGGLFSASFLFYSKSGAVIASWPFLLMIFAYVIGNELFRKHYVLLGFQISVFFTALFSYLIFFLPIILGQMGDSIFLLAGIASLMITGIFIYVLSWFAPQRVKDGAKIMVTAVVLLFGGINILYFTNLIPPIPLALKEAGIYRSLSRLPDGTYLVQGEEQEWFSLISDDPVLHIVPGEPLYLLSSVFAPTNLKTDIVHTWQYYDDTDRAWTVADTVKLGIVGGRDGGFRTYSSRENIFPGRWRVDVATPRGQLIGRLTFDIKTSNGTEKLETNIK